MFFLILCFLFAISLFKMSPTSRVPSVPKLKRLDVSHGENNMLDELSPGKSCRAVGHEFNANESNVCVK